MRLEGKVAIITGGARGIGAAIAQMLAREGAAVVIGDVLEDEGRQTAAEITAAGGQGEFLRLDVTSEESWAAAVDLAVTRFGKLNVLVNNAGIMARGPFLESTAGDWDRVMAVNAKGPYLGAKAAIPELLRAGGGSIINISSNLAMVGSYEDIQPVYGASKGAARIFTKALAIQYARQGIRVNSVHPGPIDAPMAGARLHDAALQQEADDANPMGRTAHPDEVAYGVVFLASDESSFMTGSELVIDGGATAV